MEMAQEDKAPFREGVSILPEKVNGVGKHRARYHAVVLEKARPKRSESGSEMDSET